jgi:hypothetical protein
MFTGPGTTFTKKLPTRTPATGTETDKFICKSMLDGCSADRFNAWSVKETMNDPAVEPGARLKEGSD